MTATPSTAHLTRRDFLKHTTAVAALTSAGLSPLPAAESPKPAKEIGLQIGAVSFVDEGIPGVLDLLQERAAVTTLYLTTFTYGRGLAGRQIPGQPLPDHGAQTSDEKSFHGGNYAIPHPAGHRYRHPHG